MASRKLIVELIGDDRDLKRSLDDSSKRTKRFGSSLTKLGSVAKLGAAAGVGVAVVALKSSIDAAKDAEQAEMRLNQAFDSVSASALDRKKAQEAVNRVSHQAALDDEDLSDVLAKLTRSTGSVKDAQEAMALSAEIARGRNISLEQASRSVEKAYLGNATALKRIGVVVPEVDKAYRGVKERIHALQDQLKKAEGPAKKQIEQAIENEKAQLKNAKALDKAATAHNAITKAQEQFAGSAERFGETAAGAQEKVGVAVENLQESIGKGLLPIMAKLLTALADAVEWIEKNWPKISATIEREWEQNIKPTVDAFIDLAETVYKTIHDNWDKIGPVVTAVSKVLKDNVKIIVDALKIITSLLKGDWADAWKALKDLVGTALDEVKTIVTTWATAAKKLLVAVGEKLKDALVEGLKGIAGDVWDVISGVGDYITGREKAIIGWGVGIGVAVVKGIKQGLTGIGNAVASFAGGVAITVVNAVVDLMNIAIDRVNSALEFKIPIPKLPDVHINPPDIAHIPHLAAGGIVSRPTLALIGERGPEAVVPLGPGARNAGGSYTFVFPNYVGSRDELIREVSRGVRDIERNGGRLGGTRIAPGFYA